ncbi:MAG: RagB/SusD family nutrient uptake outer membrane protein [Gemmatimonadetes bacterium]|nr:RagB/SusD family nutrient uptake outer membrane protein [Gemmatimonadota bacterium]
MALSAAVILSGCSEDFTLLSPISERNVESFYQNPTDFTVAINGAYSTLAGNGAYNRSYVLLHEMRSDNTMNGGGNTGLAEVFFRLAHFSELATASELSSPWTTAYQGIARANTILGRIDNLDDGAFKDRIRGEALFIRSLFYYQLGVLWGNVPLQLDEVRSPNVDVNQVSADVVYTQIASDLEVAQGLLPSSYDAANLGRATSGAANTLLGLVYLTNGQKAEAATALRRVVSSGEYQLVDDYANLWGVQNENNIESVFELQYKAGGTDTGSQFTDYYTPFGDGGGVGAGNAPQVLSPDIEYIHSVQYGIQENDERGFGGTWGFSVENGDTTNVWVAKWESTPFGPGDADNNFPVFRYADVLLMLAEAVGEGAEGYNLINQVRTRAGVTPIDASTPGTWEEKLLFERRLEFITEGKRWADLLRFGVAKPVMASFAPLVDAGLSQADIRLLYPIPQREIDVAPGEMVQNSN